MISSLHIENIAVIKRADIPFHGGFTVLTGETGAGKSILIDSINLILGARAQRALVRNGEESAMVSALFADLPERVVKPLEEIGVSIDEEGLLMLQRNVAADGKGSSRLNGRQVPLGLQKDAAELLVNIHGQHDNQALLNPDSHVGFLDAFAEVEEELAAYKRCYHKLSETKQRLKTLSKDETEKNRLIELLKYQIGDIDAVRLKSGEEELLLTQKKKIQNLEKIAKYCNTAYAALYQSEKGISAHELIGRAQVALQMIAEVIPEATEYAEKLGDIKDTIADIADFALASGEMDGVGDPTALLDRIEGRLDLIGKLKRKYGSTVEEILAYREKAAKELSEIQLSDELSEELTEQLTKDFKAAYDAAALLHGKRKLAAEVLSRKIVDELKFLEMDKVGFVVSFVEQQTPSGNPKLGPNGYDEVEFLIATNPGEPAKPLSKIASGGELSRIMLALKCVFARRDRIPTLIFDEIDTGVSGKTLQKIGIKLKQLSGDAQVICVTHSAQIAALADHHYLITKEEKDGRVQTSVRELDKEGRVREVARIMGGIQITDKLMETAKEMIETATFEE